MVTAKIKILNFLPMTNEQFKGTINPETIEFRIGHEQDIKLFNIQCNFCFNNNSKTLYAFNKSKTSFVVESNDFRIGPELLKTEVIDTFIDMVQMSLSHSRYHFFTMNYKEDFWIPHKILWYWDLKPLVEDGLKKLLN